MANLTFMCPDCSAELLYSAANQNWTCDYCDGQFTLEQLTAATDAAKLETLQSDIQKERAVDKEDYQSTVTDDDSDFWVESETRDLVAYSCSYCQAEIITSRTTSATICPYCQHSVVIKNALVAEFSPEYVVPFKVVREQADKEFKKFMKKPLTPKAFYTEVNVHKVQGIYVPFWMFSGRVEGDLSCTGVRDRSTSDYEIKEIYECRRKCDIQFSNVCVDASKKIEDSAMDSIEPFDITQAQPFNPAFLSGYLAERYDQTDNEVYPRCKSQVETSAQRFCERDIQMDFLQSKNFGAAIQVKKPKYVMLPAWILYCTYKEKRYLFAMNGQTGKFIGNLPLDPLKTFLAGLSGTLAGALIGLVIGML